MLIFAPGTFSLKSANIADISDTVRKPCAIVPPKGVSAARSRKQRIAAGTHAGTRPSAT